MGATDVIFDVIEMYFNPDFDLFEVFNQRALLDTAGP